MSQTFPRTWNLSQTANKESGICSVCLSVRQLHLTDGTVHVHGPRHSHCPGSDKPPRQSDGNHAAIHDLAVTSCSQTDTKAAPTCSTQPGSVQSDQLQPGPKANGSPPDAAQQSGPSHPPPGISTVKHIPRPARAACARHLENVLRRVISNPTDTAAWDLLLNFGHDILRASERGGRKRNLASTILKRTNDDRMTMKPISIHPLPILFRIQPPPNSSSLSQIGRREHNRRETLAKLQLKSLAEYKEASFRQRCSRTQPYKLVKKMCYAPFARSRQAHREVRRHQTSTTF